MPFRGVADPEQLAMLQRVLADYCAEHGVPDEEIRDAVAASPIVLFDGGLQTPEELSAALR